MSAPPVRGWPRSAKIVTVVLALTTIGATIAGLIAASSATNDTHHAEQQLERVRGDVTQTQDALEAAQRRAEHAEADLASTQTDLESALSERDAVAAAADGLRSLFPLDSSRFDLAPLEGTYALSIDPESTECHGYADDATACRASSLPAQIQVAGDAASGYTISSSHFAATPLTRVRRFTASGTVDDDVADLCNGEIVPTTFVVTLAVDRVGLDTTDRLEPLSVVVTYTMEAEGSASCAATSRKVTFRGTPA